MIKIGGNEYPTRLLYRDMDKITKRYFFMKRYDDKLREKGRSLDWSRFIFWVLWIMIESRGRWLWRKPFRSPGKIRRAMWWEEYQPAADYITSVVVGKREEKEPDPQKSQASN